MSIHGHNEIRIRFYNDIIKWNAIIMNGWPFQLKKSSEREGKTRYSRINKAGLIKKISEPPSPREPTRKELREKAKNLKISGYS